VRPPCAHLQPPACRFVLEIKFKDFVTIFAHDPAALAEIELRVLQVLCCVSRHCVSRHCVRSSCACCRCSWSRSPLTANR
jgi:hypothetical protein